MALCGIDLGTTNSLISVFEEGGPRLVPNALGEFLTPSVVGVDEDGSIIVGKAARERSTEDVYGVLQTLLIVEGRADGVATNLIVDTMGLGLQTSNRTDETMVLLSRAVEDPLLERHREALRAERAGRAG